METTLFLVRHGETDWHRQGRILGAMDMGLNADGINQAHSIMSAFEGLDIAEILSSPALRAMQTAEVIAGVAGIEVARDPRLSDLQAGPWGGKYYKDLAKDPAYERFLRDPLSEPTPGGERLTDVRDRALASLQQALADNASGENVIVVTHAEIIRLVLAHYLGASLGGYHRIRVSLGSISILRFRGDNDLPRVLALNLIPGGGLVPLLR